MRISGDSPFFDPQLATRMAADPALEDCDIVTNLAPRSFPPGNSIEIVTTAALGRCLQETTDAGDREHVTTFIYRNASRFRLHNVFASENFDGISLTVDYERDLTKVEWIAARLQPPLAAAPFGRVAELCRAWQTSGEP